MSAISLVKPHVLLDALMPLINPAISGRPTLPRCVRLLILCACLPLAAVAHAEDKASKGQEDKHGTFSGAVQTTYPDWFKTSFLDLEEDVAEAAEAGKRLMLLFHQDGCPYCNALVERNLAQKDIAEKLQSEFDVIEINIWGDREVASVQGETYSEKEFAAALKVQFTPTVLFLDEAGALALRINGYYDPDRFRQVLDYVSGKMEKTLSFSDYSAQRGEADSSAQLVSRPYFTGPLSQLADRPGKGSKPLLLFFEQAGCRNCDTLHEDILSKPESRELLAQFDSYQIDMWGREEFISPQGQSTTGRQWSSELDIAYAPTLVLYSADGVEVIRSEAWFKTFHTQSILDYVLSEQWREQPNFQRYLSARAEQLNERGIDVDIWD